MAVSDHPVSIYIVQSEFYDNQRQEVVEDTFHKAILKHGKCDACYLDNGTQYTTNQLHAALARLGIRVLHAKPRACESKGKILYDGFFYPHLFGKSCETSYFFVKRCG